MIELYKNRVVMDNDDYAKLLALWRAARDWRQHDFDPEERSASATALAVALDALGPHQNEASA